MTSLYELRAHRTDCYDRSSDIRIRLSAHRGMEKVRDWLDGYFTLFPTGKVEVFVVSRTSRLKERTRKMFSVSASEYITALAKQKGG